MIDDLTSLFIQLVALVAKYKIILLFFACMGLGAAGAWLIAGMPFRQRLLDTPNERSSHTTPHATRRGCRNTGRIYRGGPDAPYSDDLSLCGDPHLRCKFLRGLYPDLGEIPSLLFRPFLLLFSFFPCFPV